MTDTTIETRAYWRDPALGARRELELPDGTITIFESGTGHPVVLVHGLVVNANLWRAVVPRLAGENHCVTVDLPFGSHARPMPDTDLTPPGLARLVIQALDALRLGPVTLVGNDTGGVVCQLVAIARPDLVAHLVLTSCDAYENFPPTAFGYLKLLARMPGGVAAIAAGLRIPAVRRLPLAYGWLAKHPLGRAASDSYALPATASRGIRADLRRLLRGLDNRHTLTAARSFAEVKQPVLLAWSQADRFFAPRYAERMAQDFPDARIEWIPDAYTFSPEDQPDLLSTAIANFVRESQVRGRDPR
ncbi:alpha/beta fold hydrolase [Nocardia huaxiensis]|uniref:alpha/beta fold hydrolase n=1 Tax=Nocardia huaxiensis TaxID=2755382 RepID=UPI001E29E89F|nr:alpha/beta hydrolase [Nocardia huaxiensis]UFS96102.1 alpha/beta hydrolase [Nocardia huaxiensis]